MKIRAADRIPSQYEALALERWERRLRWHARDVHNPARVSMTVDDVYAEMTQAVVLAARRFTAAGYEGPPSDPWVATFVRRAKLRLWRKAGSRREFTDLVEIDTDTGAVTEAQVPDTEATPADAMVADADLQRACEALAYAVKRGLPPAAFAVLHLRYLEEMSADEIAEAIGLPATEHRRLTARIENARIVAAELLATLGVKRIAQVGATSAEDYDADELDDHR